MTKPIPYEMTDEELEIFNERFDGVMVALNNTPAHLVSPLLVRVLITSYFLMKDIPKTEQTMKLAQYLANELSTILLTKTERYIQELN